jgi:hypothetical protein
MKRLLPITLLGLLVCSGCNGDEDRLSINIVFPDDAAKEAAQSVTIYSIVPDAGSDCSALMSGTAIPGDAGFTIEDQLSIQKPANKSSDPLEMGDAGPRLFYAEGFDQADALILKGCQPAEWTGKGPKTITITLQNYGQPCTQNSDCDDGLFCTGDEVCTNNACVPGFRDCDDSDDCTVDACNEDQDQCDHTPVQNPPAEGPPGDATCSDSIDNDCDGFTDGDDPECITCSTDAECDDSDPCTEDTCTAGECVNNPISTGCGCGTPPDSASLFCQDPVSLAAGDTSACTLSLSGGDNTGLADCITCTAKAGVTVVDASDFGSGACDADGWTLVTGNNCRARVDNCATGGGPQACCDTFAGICEDATFGQPVLRTELNANCGGGIEQWRLQKTFDLGGLTSPSVCFDLAGNQASANSGLLVFAEDGQNASQQIFCNNGMPQPDVNDFFYTYCVDLPGWAADSPDTMLTFLMHSDGAGETLYLDNISVRGWGGGCARDVVSVLDDDFAGCDISGWTINGTFQCPGFDCSSSPGWSPGLEGDNESFTMETVADASSLDGDIRACIQLGHDGTGGGDRVALLYNAGSGFQLAWEQTDQLGPHGECREICTNLSDIAPDANNNPTLGIQLVVDSNNGKIDIYRVTITGAQFCQATPAVIAVGSPPTDDGGGSYSFDVTDAHGEQLTAAIRCELDPVPAVNASASIRFQP